MHIDKYKIYSYGKSWNKGKESKTATIQKMLTSDDCIDGKQFLRLLDDLEDAWHTHENKDCTIEVTFEDRKE